MIKPKHLRLKLSDDQRILHVRINRPEVRNSFNEELIADFQTVFSALSSSDRGELEKVRAVVLRGEGPAFCGGGDLNWMKNSLNLSHDENVRDCQNLTHMFNTMDRCPVPVIGLVHGFAIGGGVGLVSVCDHVIAADSTVFSLSEVKLGLIPACIGPFVIAKIGVSQARSLFVSGERFKADKALKINLVHEICAESELDARGEQVARQVAEGGPVAVAAAKFLIHTLSRDLVREDFSKSMEFAAAELAQLRVLPEAQEGVRAFLEKRAPEWRK